MRESLEPDFPHHGADVSLRILEILVSAILLMVVVVVAGLLLPLYVIVGESPFFVAERVGRNKRLFKMFKFRTYRSSAPLLSAESFQDKERYLLPFGRIMRECSIDELPQVLNILLGDMGFLGPRPALPCQLSLLELREDAGLIGIKPGLTGLAQVVYRKSNEDIRKVSLESSWKLRRTVWLDTLIICATLIPLSSIKKRLERHFA